MRALILIDHGSHRDEANAVVRDVAAHVRSRRPDLIVEHAHMELCEPTLREAFAECVRQGAREITVQPYFLGPGRHATEDIPRSCAEAAKAHPGIAWNVTSPFGAQPAMADVVLSSAFGDEA